MCSSFLSIEQDSSASANALWNMSLVYLLLGDYERGWPLYEARFKTKGFEKTTIPSSGMRIENLKQLRSYDASNGPLCVWRRNSVLSLSAIAE